MQRRFSVGYISFEHVCKYYQTCDTVVKAVDDVNFTIEKGEFCVVLGPSGAGKTTILNLLGGMDKATSGTITVGGIQIIGLRSPQLTDYRRTYVGFVFQVYNLMPNLTALENVELARQVCKDALDPKTVMEQVGLSQRMNNFPAQLSGGEQQMLAVGRGLMSRPKVLMMDEPSLGLAPLVVQGIFDIIREINRQGVTILLIEQNANMALKIADLAYVLETGTITMSGTGAEQLADEKVNEASHGQQRSK